MKELLRNIVLVAGGCTLLLYACLGAWTLSELRAATSKYYVVSYMSYDTDRRGLSKGPGVVRNKLTRKHPLLWLIKDCNGKEYSVCRVMWYDEIPRSVYDRLQGH